MALRLSQSALARMAGVDRIYLCLHELGDRRLNAQNEKRVEAALRHEVERISDACRSVMDEIASPLKHYNSGHDHTSTTEEKSSQEKSSGGGARLARRKGQRQSAKAANPSRETEPDRAHRRQREMGVEMGEADA
jgi:hypothetical protein